MSEKKGFFKRLAQGLSKTRDNIASSFDSIFSGFSGIDEDFYEELEEILIMSDMGIDTTMNIIEDLKKKVKENKIKEPEECRQLLIDSIKDQMRLDDSAYDFIDKKSVVLVIGVNGVGKTTSVGKLAASLKGQGKKVLLAAADTFRAGAIEQLKEWSNRAGVDIISQAEGADPAAVVYDAVAAAKARDVDVLLCDTAGRLHNKKNLMNELSKINRIIQKEYSEAYLETLIVLDGTTGQNAMAQAKQFKEATDISGIILTKLDGTAKGGVVIGIVAENKIVYYECTRGCPFQCSYCLSGISHSVRRRPLEKVLLDLEHFMEAKVPLVKFVDRTYNLDETYFLPIMHYLSMADTETTFHFEIKADLLSENTLKFLETVPEGRFQFEIGVQSTNTKTLEAIGRENNWKKLADNVGRLLQNNNIHLHLDLIAGLPYEGLKEFIKSFNDVYGLRPHMLQLGFLKVLQGTVMQSQAQEHGLLYMSEPPYEVVQTKYMGYEELRFLKVLEDVFENTYNTGKFNNVLAYLIKANNGTAFDFYRKLTEWWESRGLYPQGHNARGVTKLLWEFTCDCYPSEKTNVKEILRFDVFVSQPNWLPSWMGWKTAELNERAMAFWRDKDEVRQYLPDYIFSTWRQIRKNYPIEAFDYNVYSGVAERVVFMADYSNGKCIVKPLISKYLQNN